MKTKLNPKQKKLLERWTDENKMIKTFNDLNENQKKELESGKYSQNFIDDVNNYLGKLFFAVNCYKK